MPGCQHRSDGQQPEKESQAYNGVQKRRSVNPNELHRDAQNCRRWGDHPQNPADLPLVPGRYDEGHAGSGESGLTGDPPDVVYRFHDRRNLDPGDSVDVGNFGRRARRQQKGANTRNGGEEAGRGKQPRRQRR